MQTLHDVGETHRNWSKWKKAHLEQTRQHMGSKDVELKCY